MRCVIESIGRGESVQHIYEVNATVKDCRRLKGYRASIYNCAQDCVAFYPIGKGFIYYEDGSSDLTVCLWFENKDHAHDFQNVLSRFANEHSRFKEKLVLERDLRKLPLPTAELSRVMRDDYKPADNADSPLMSLNDVMSDGDSCVSVSHDPAFALQSLEDVGAVARFDSKWYKCHLVGKTDDVTLADNSNNVIYESWNFHQLFDGLNTVTRVGVLIECERVEAEEEVLVADGKYEKRQKLIVKVTFKNPDVAKVMESYLKHGTERIDDTSYRSFLFARDAAVMKGCLDRKLAVSRGKW